MRVRVKVTGPETSAQFNRLNFLKKQIELGFDACFPISGTPVAIKVIFFAVMKGPPLQLLLGNHLKFVAYLLADIRSFDLNQRRFLFALPFLRFVGRITS